MTSTGSDSHVDYPPGQPWEINSEDGTEKGIAIHHIFDGQTPLTQPLEVVSSCYEKYYGDDGNTQLADAVRPI